MKTTKERREVDRKRQEKYRNKQTKLGKKTITATISKEAYEALYAIKNRTGESNSSVVERALLSLNIHE